MELAVFHPSDVDPTSVSNVSIEIVMHEQIQIPDSVSEESFTQLLKSLVGRFYGNATLIPLEDGCSGVGISLARLRYQQCSMVFLFSFFNLKDYTRYLSNGPSFLFIFCWEK